MPSRVEPLGASYTDLYKDPREEHQKMAPYLWARAAFDHMREDHLALIRKYRNRPQTLGVSYQGIANLPPEAKPWLSGYRPATMRPLPRGLV